MPWHRRLNRDHENAHAKAQADADNKCPKRRVPWAGRGGRQNQDRAAGDQTQAAKHGDQTVGGSDHDPRAEDAGQRPTDRHRAENEAAGQRAVAHGALHISRKKRGNPQHHRARGATAQRPNDDDAAVTPKLNRQHGFRSGDFVGQQQRAGDNAKHEH